MVDRKVLNSNYSLLNTVDYCYEIEGMSKLVVISEIESVWKYLEQTSALPFWTVFNVANSPGKQKSGLAEY